MRKVDTWLESTREYALWGGERHTRERVRERKSKYCPLRETAEEAFLDNCFLKSARSNYGAKHGRGKVRKHQH